MQKIAMFGGTFNPIHNGHIHLCGEFASRLSLDKILFIPTSLPPHKQPLALAPAEHRLAMCRLCCTSPLYETSDIEIKRSGKSYTADTLAALSEQFPGAELYMIIGADMFLTIEHWRDPQRIFDLCTLCAAPREDCDYEALSRYNEHLRSKGVRTCIEDIPLLPVSSTIVREAVSSGQSIRQLVPPAVADYIEMHKLYRKCNNDH